jgi:hypothetical protein
LWARQRCAQTVVGVVDVMVMVMVMAVVKERAEEGGKERRKEGRSWADGAIRGQGLADSKPCATGHRAWPCYLYTSKYM